MTKIKIYKPFDIYIKSKLLSIYNITIYKQTDIMSREEIHLQISYSYEDGDLYGNQHFLNIIEDYLQNYHEIIYDHNINWTEPGMQHFSLLSVNNSDYLTIEWPLNSIMTQHFIDNFGIEHPLEKGHLIVGI